MPKIIHYIAYNLKMIVFILIIATLLFISFYTQDRTYEIHYAYDGIKYQIGNIDSGTPVYIEVDGTYTKRYWGEGDDFEGTIKIDGELCYSRDNPGNNEYGFNNYHMSQIENKGLQGSFFINDMFKEITIEIHEVLGPGGRRFSYKNGWLIAAPCKTREQAVDVSNRLIQMLHKSVIIK